MNGKRISTGIRGLDLMLRGGGLIPGRTYLVKGAPPGTGKTTLAVHFAMAGVANGEDVLYVTLEEPADNIRADMTKMGFNLNDSRFTLIDATPPTSERYVLVEDFFESFAGSMEKMTQAIKEKLRERRYTRIVLDPITMLKFTSPEEIEYRRAFLSFVKSMGKMGATVLMTSEFQRTDIEEYLVSGVIELKMFDIQGDALPRAEDPEVQGEWFRPQHEALQDNEQGGMVVYHDRVISLP